MTSPVLVAMTALWVGFGYAVATDWQGLRSRRPYAYPLAVVGGLLYVVREWGDVLVGLDPAAGATLAAASNLAFLGALGAFAWRWWQLREPS